MKILIFGSTGMLGKKLYVAAQKRKHLVKGIARSGTDYALDIRDAKEIKEIIVENNPDIIINTIAITNIDYCENYYEDAYSVNTRPASFLAEISSNLGIYLIQISSDHYYTGDGLKLHDENYPVTLVNEYARTKFLAECLIRTYTKSLVVRTNIVGFKGAKENPTFIEWCISMLINKTPSILFDDFYTSSIDVGTFSEILLDLIDMNITGIINISSRDVTSKRIFIETFAEKLELDFSHTTSGSVCELKGVKRAESLGLDVCKVEKLLGYRMPDLHEVIKNLVTEFQGLK